MWLPRDPPKGEPPGLPEIWKRERLTTDDLFVGMMKWQFAFYDEDEEQVEAFQTIPNDEIRLNAKQKVENDNLFKLGHAWCAFYLVRRAKELRMVLKTDIDDFQEKDGWHLRHVHVSTGEEVHGPKI